MTREEIKEGMIIRDNTGKLYVYKVDKNYIYMLILNIFIYNKKEITAITTPGRTFKRDIEYDWSDFSVIKE